MNRSYELVFIADPRLTDEQVVGLSDDYKSMIKAAGGNIVREESWGKRKLAYPIAKLTEGQYVILYVETPEGVNPFPEVEQRLRQNEKILRYLTVRTDLDLKRAARKGKIKKPRTGPHAGSDSRDSRPDYRDSRSDSRDGRAESRDGREART